MLAIIDYGSGNLRSVAKALERVSGGNTSIVVTDDLAQVRQASHLLLPGVGAFADCMGGLSALPGMLEALQEQVLHKQTWFLGICVGMQMLFERGHEHGVHAGLGWLKGEVVKLAKDGGRKIPHMGWNELQLNGAHPLLAGIAEGEHAYFVHSYQALCANPSDILATTSYGQPIAAVVGQGNIMGTQFHPEKSQETGLKLLGNFLNL